MASHSCEKQERLKTRNRLLEPQLLKRTAKLRAIALDTPSPNASIRSHRRARIRHPELRKHTVPHTRHIFGKLVEYGWRNCNLGCVNNCSHLTFQQLCRKCVLLLAHWCNNDYQGFINVLCVNKGSKGVMSTGRSMASCGERRKKQTRKRYLQRPQSKRKRIYPNLFL